jgi:hypothetical protein
MVAGPPFSQSRLSPRSALQFLSQRNDRSLCRRRGTKTALASAGKMIALGGSPMPPGFSLLSIIVADHRRPFMRSTR